MPKRSTIRLNDASVRTALRTSSVSDRFIWDADLPGFGLRIKPSGTFAFLIQYRRGTRTRRFVLRGYIKPAEARAEAQGLLSLIHKDTTFDPSQKRRTERRAVIAAEAGSFETVAKQFLDTPAVQQRRSRAEIERILFGSSLDESRSEQERRAGFKGYIVPEWKGLHIRSIRRLDVVQLLDKVKTKNGPAMARKVLEVMRSLFEWYEGQDEDFVMPVVRSMAKRLPKTIRRERVLSDEEMRRVWSAAANAQPPIFGTLVRALLLTGVRRDEMASARWDEIAATGHQDGKALVVPPERVKRTEREKEPAPHVVPLSRPMQRLLEMTPHLGEFVFTTNNRTPFSGFSKAKRLLDAASGVSGWRLHDLRRTARTLMSRAGINPEHAELAIGHKLKGVRAVYDRHPYLAERRDALDALATLLERILDKTTAEVVEFGSRAGPQRRVA